MEWGVSEIDFWNMTLSELTRLINSKKKIQEKEAKEMATHNYILADMIGRSIARIASSANTFAPISEFYPGLFTSEELEEKAQEKRDELSVLRFKQFAQSYNTKFKEASKLNE